MTKEVKKVWGFNCFGVCIVLIQENKIDEYNAKHPLFNEKIVSWKNANQNKGVKKMSKLIYVKSKFTGYCYMVFDELQFHNPMQWEIITKEQYFKENK